MSTIPSLSSLNESYRIHASSGRACFFWGGAVGSQKGGHLNLASCVTRARWLSYLNLNKKPFLSHKFRCCHPTGIVLSPKALTHHHREVLNEPGTTSLSFHHFLQPIRLISLQIWCDGARCYWDQCIQTAAFSWNCTWRFMAFRAQLTCDTWQLRARQQNMG